MTMRLASRNEQVTPKTFGVSRSSSWMKWFSKIWNIENIKVVRRVIVSVIGVTVLLIGVALLVLPGPAFIVIPIGLAILATEYAWARRWLRKVRRMASGVVSGRSRTTPEDSGV
jgi:uncharacterized protein (TIGR02611 family)